jgi:alkylated DNA repair dioxygenase AlkB
VGIHQRSLFGLGDPAVDPHAAFERRDLDQRAWIDVARGFLRGADSLLDRLVASVEWRQGRRRMYDRMVDDPRLSRSYTRRDHLPDAALHEIRDALQEHYGVELGGVGLNYYRDGRDSVAPHRDRELRQLDNTIVAIVTLGAKRPFLVRPHSGGRSIDVSPASGDLLVMGGTCQQHYEHGVPKVAHAGPRISASYRWTAQPDEAAPGGSS